jgi:cytoskeletal protein RodZ
MSQLGKILLYVALVGGLAAVAGAYMIIQKRGEDATNLAQVTTAKTASDAAAKKAQAEAKAAEQAQTDAEAKATAASSKVDDLNTQLTASQKAAADATTALQTANDAVTAANAKVDSITKSLNGKTVDEYVQNATKAQSDLDAATAEQKIMQDQLDANKQTIADLQGAINNEKSGKMPGVSGKVTFVDHAWNFVILDVGLNSGVVPNGELIVYRGRNFLGKVRVTKVDPSDSVAEILPDIKGDIQIGDAVLN